MYDCINYPVKLMNDWHYIIIWLFGHFWFGFIDIRGKKLSHGNNQSYTLVVSFHVVLAERMFRYRCFYIFLLVSVWESYTGAWYLLFIFTGDCIILYTQSDPWRPVRVIVNDSSLDDAVVSISWSLDSSRLITVNKSVSLYKKKNNIKKKKKKGL
jgi:hypothetical protein